MNDMLSFLSTSRNSTGGGRGGTRGRSQLGSRLMSLLEKVWLVKKKERNSRSEHLPRSRKPREHWGPLGKTGMGQAALCLGSF